MMTQPTARTLAARADRGRIVTESYGADLAALMTDLAAYADTLGPASFANNVNTALARNGKAGVSFN